MGWDCRSSTVYAGCSTIDGSDIAARRGLALRRFGAAGITRQPPVESAATFDTIANPAQDKLIVVIDDDALVPMACACVARLGMPGCHCWIG